MIAAPANAVLVAEPAPRRCDHCTAPMTGWVFVVRVRVGRDLLVCSRRCQRRES